MERVMKPIGLILLALVATSGLASAQTADPSLQLQQGAIFSDPVGSVVGVTVTNTGSAVIGSVLVTCSFTAGGKPAGSANTTIYNIVAGANGQDQVHLMGAKADKAACTLGATTAPLN